jgi:hypothetical protein
MAALSWGITIPFREDPNPEIDRNALLQVVLKYLAEFEPEAPVLIVDSDATLPFNRAAARNECVRQAELLGWDVVVILDADTLPPLGLMAAAVQGAAKAGIHQPFRYCVTLDPQMNVTPRTLNSGHLGRHTAHRLWISPGSCYILKPETYWQAGGQDEGFTHWGGEDSAFMSAAKAFGISVTRHPVGARKTVPENTAVQLHHGDATDRRHHPTYPATKRRQNIYHRLSRDPKRMQQWIDERYLPDAEDRWDAALPSATRHAAAIKQPRQRVTSAVSPSTTT